MSKLETLLRPLGKVLGFDSKPPAPPKPPTVADKSVIAEREKQRRAMVARQGFGDAILTQPKLGETAAPVERKTLLGS